MRDVGWQDLVVLRVGRHIICSTYTGHLCAVVYLFSRIYRIPGSVRFFFLTQLLVRSAIRNCGIVVITVVCANTHKNNPCPSGDSHSQNTRWT